MHRLPRLLVLTAASFVGIAAITGVMLLARSGLVTVEELAVGSARRAPIDYGAGPGRGMPKTITPVARKTLSNASAGGGGVSPDLTPPGEVASITITNGGSYIANPTCTIAAPNTPGGTQATCSVSTVGVNLWRLFKSTPGTGYKVGDLLTMNPMPGLSCGLYPIIQVGSVSGSGGITGVLTRLQGQCSSIPAAGTYTFSGGEGSGYTTPTGSSGIQWLILFASVPGRGSGYATAPAVTFSASKGGVVATATTAVTPSVAPPAPVPNGGPAAGTGGAFGSPVYWPVIAIHQVLLPDGRILNYGTNQLGNQGAQFVYDIWDPSLGTGQGSHLVLPNVTQTDIFCGVSSMLWNSGQVLLAGGDLTVEGQRNYANNKTAYFSPTGNSLTTGPQMSFPRWYASLVPLPSGDEVAFGGYQTRPATADSGAAQTTPVVQASTPELYHQGAWIALPGATVTSADWYYPRVFVSPSGSLIEVSSETGYFTFTTAGAGTVKATPKVLATGSPMLTAAMYATGRIMAIRLTGVQLVNINGPTPVITSTAPLDQLRYHANATVLADGEVLVNGGASVPNQLPYAAYTTQLWNPATGQWTTGAAAAKSRMYHSTSLLLPDGTVVTAGGGAPGPVTNLNAEIYYPPYLYLKDGSGNPAPRPAIASVQSPQGGLKAGQTFSFAMSNANMVSRVTLLRAGAVTHTSNLEQRFLDLTPTMVQNGSQISVTLPSNPNVVMPGYWLLFAFNQAGVPSTAPQVLVTN